MKLFVFASLIVATIQADQWCNQTAGRGESIFEAFPINTFSTSGADTIRANWCLTACSSKTSLKASMLFQAAAKSQGAIKKLRITKVPSRNGPVKLVNNKVVQFNGETDWQYCADPVIQAAVAAAVNQSDDVNSIATQLNQSINRPGWAYLVVKMGYLPTEVELNGLIIDPDFCYAVIHKKSNGAEEEFAIYSGLVHA